jgi:stage II sporulation protein D
LQPTTVLSENATVSAQYRGDFRVEYSLHEVVDRWTQVVTYSGQHWSLMNEVSVEDYLAAVVPSEMPASFGEEALKAQAVAARTYVVFHSWLARKILGRTWDVDPTTWFQSYRGAQVENALILSAVKATTGEILISSDKVIEAFFSANSGGVVCRISECFWLPDRPYAVTKNDVAGVREKPGGRWTSKVTSQGVWDRLQKIESEGRLSLAQLAPHLQGPQDITALEAERLGESGRTWQLSIMSKSGPAVILNEEFTREMRWQFGFKTSFYNMTGTNKLGMQLVEGYGLGHGVGMSQWGATLLAAEGRVYTDILKFYYEGVTVARLP